ncbi:hypothetical protein SteCoe_13164 [Stentor coeruleus]|uniref:Protein kinase domain-containing protein n=1 Tax=Stentor coeruleus TaxID=5963 RepID=A0A1R2C900_9CILI|nr:hypothetical protein SteCoe_13164 [Stentor coeruleus]
MESTKITIIMNGNIDKTCEAFVHKRKGINELMTECKEKLHIPHHVKCILYDSTGGELSDDDMEYMNPEEPVFISQGEEFLKSSSMAIYKELSILGEGGFGSVHLYEHKLTGKQVAIKFVDTRTIFSPEDVNRVYSEIGVLRGLKHPNIVVLEDAFDCDGKICFVMEYCSGGEIKDYIEQKFPLPESEVYNLACQIAEAIRYCHNSKVIHRDLKLENILFSNSSKTQIKIVDFGIAGIFAVGATGERSDAGSLLYIAPEVLSGTDNRANPALDVWSMGCIFYSLLMKNLPFNGEYQDEVIPKILKAEYPPLRNSISKPWHKLIKGMLRVNPLKRWNLVKITEHLYKYKYDGDASLSSDSDEDVVAEEAKSPNKKKVGTFSQATKGKSTNKNETKNVRGTAKVGKISTNNKSPTKVSLGEKKSIKSPTGIEKK